MRTFLIQPSIIKIQRQQSLIPFQSFHQLTDPRIIYLMCHRFSNQTISLQINQSYSLIDFQ